MASRRYAVLDENGVCVNVVMIDEPIAMDYKLQYGHYLVDVSPSPPLMRADIPTPTKPPNKPLAIGDTMNVTSGNVTKFVPQMIQSTDPATGLPMTVASAPQVVLRKTRFTTEL